MGRPRAPRPIQLFRAIGIFVLVLGLIAGGYLVVGRSARSTPDNYLSLDAPAPATPSVSASGGSVLTDAQKRAEAAARDAVDKTRKADEAASRSLPRTTPPYPVPASCAAYSGNRATGCAILLERGFGLDQMPCLDKLFTKESGWNPKARNKSSGAYGIPQALPGTKMASAGADWETNPATQIKWGVGYIKTKYKTPCAAWARSQSTGSY